MKDSEYAKNSVDLLSQGLISAGWILSIGRCLAAWIDKRFFLKGRPEDVMQNQTKAGAHEATAATLARRKILGQCPPPRAAAEEAYSDAAWGGR